MGSTQRPKQYLELAGRTVIEWALAPFLHLERCERIVSEHLAQNRPVTAWIEKTNTLPPA